MRKLVNKGVFVDLSEKGINIYDGKTDKSIKRGNYNRRFGWLNFELAN